MEPGTKLDERRDTAGDANGAACRLRDAGDKLESRALPRPIAPDDAVSRALRNRERYILQRLESLLWLQVAHDAPLQNGALERGKLPAAVAPEDLRYVRELDRGCHTASANESLSRSKNQYAAMNRRTEAAPSARSHFQWPNLPVKNRIS